MSKDIVDRIRSLRYVHVPVASQLFEEAANEIERLRLTQRERDAIEGVIAEEYRRGAYFWADTLKKLLKRTEDRRGVVEE